MNLRKPRVKLVEYKITEWQQSQLDLMLKAYNRAYIWRTKKGLIKILNPDEIMEVRT